jgi:hypothetical protein
MALLWRVSWQPNPAAARPRSPTNLANMDANHDGDVGIDGAPHTSDS